LDALVTSATTATTDKDANVDDNDANTNKNKESPTTMGSKKGSTAAASKKPAMMSVNNLTNHLQGASISTQAKKGPVYYSILLRDAYILRSFLEDVIRFKEVNLLVGAGALTLSKCNIAVTLTSDCMSLSIQ
jgi:hypothetical protein